METGLFSNFPTQHCEYNKKRQKRVQLRQWVTQQLTSRGRNPAVQNKHADSQGNLQPTGH